VVSDRKLILNAELGSYTEEVTMMCFYCLHCCMYVMRHMNRISSLELNPVPPKYKAGALTCEPQHSLICHYEHSCVEFHSTFAVLTVFCPHNSSMLLSYTVRCVFTGLSWNSTRIALLQILSVKMQHYRKEPGYVSGFCCSDYLLTRTIDFLLPSTYKKICKNYWTVFLIK